jgi:hypothetical protein
MNKLCEKCRKDCKQLGVIKILKCPFYEKADERNELDENS